MDQGRLLQHELTDNLTSVHEDSPAEHSDLVTREAKLSQREVLDATLCRGDEIWGGRLEAVRVLALALFREVGCSASIRNSNDVQAIDFYDEVQRFECGLIRSALTRTRGRQRRAARLLGMNVATLNGKIKKYGIDTHRNEDFPTAGLGIKAP